MSARQRRRRGPTGPGPWIVVGAMALIPAMALYGIHRWSSARADESTDAEAVAELDEEGVVAVGEAPAARPALDTVVMSFRRVPGAVAFDASLDDFSAEVVPVFAGLNDRSCAAVSVDGRDVAAYNEELAVIPASNQKLVVAATALERLGEDFRYRTVVGAAAEPSGGVVDGDLFLIGGGDPLLSSDWYPTSNLERYPVTSPTSLDQLADSVVAAGVRQITGGVVGDGTRYDDEFFAPGWGLGVAGLEGGPYDALLVNDARVLGDAQRSGDPSEAAAREFARLLVERGVTIGGGTSSGAAPASNVEVATIDSAPLADVVAEMLGSSDNNTAELMVKELGVDAAATGTREAGLEVMRDQLAAWGVDVGPIVLADGSGLSLDNRLTCAAVLEVLQRTGVDSPVGQGLPVAAQTGTLADAFVDHPAAGLLTGKTGTLGNPPFNADPPAVKALAGYVPVDGGGAVEYALILNGPTISDQSEYRPVWNSLADALVTYPAGPSPAELSPR